MSLKITQLFDFIPPDAGNDGLLLVVLFGLGAAIFLVAAGVVEAAIALRGWLASYAKGGE